MIAIIDWGMGNPGSILNMLKRLNAPAILTKDPEIIDVSRKIVLPGVGAYDEGMGNLGDLGIIDVLRKKAIDRSANILGICLGMQLLFEGSEEGKRPGLAMIRGFCRRIRPTAPAKVPHMGWNSVHVARNGPLFYGLEAGARFYFVHSYHCECADPNDAQASTLYGGLDLTAAVVREKIIGVQFHPEKSHRYGLQLLHNFVRI
jgi:glutamine amidotransferase